MSGNHILRFIAAAGLSAGIAAASGGIPVALAHDGPTWDTYDNIYDEVIALRRKVADLNQQIQQGGSAGSEVEDQRRRIDELSWQLRRSQENEKLRDLHAQKLTRERDRLRHQLAEEGRRANNLARRLERRRGRFRSQNAQIANLSRQVSSLRQRLKRRRGRGRAQNAQVANLSRQVSSLRQRLRARCAAPPPGGRYRGDLRRKDQVIHSLNGRVAALNREISHLHSRLDRRARVNCKKWRKRRKDRDDKGDIGD